MTDTPPDYIIRQCRDDNCRFRFPITAVSPLGQNCPVCQSPTRIMQQYSGYVIQQTNSPPQTPPIHILLDNLRSTYNVGSIFRTADGAGVAQMHLCGTTPTPDSNAKVAKTALGAEQSVTWHYYRNALDTAVALKQQNFQLIAIEGGPQAQSIFHTRPSMSQPTLLIFGNELAGVDPDILAQCDHILSIPMTGIKNSLNVTVAVGIAVYNVMYQQTK